MNRRFTLTAVCRTLVTGSLLVLFHTANAQPQNPTGIPQGIPPIDFNRVSVQGSVTDDSGYAIPGAIVRFRNEVTGGITKKHTDEDGEYGATLSPGTYVVTVEADGFESFTTRVELPYRVNIGIKQVDLKLREDPIQRITGRSTLHPKQNERLGYGLYSYLLFSKTPGKKDKELREMYLAAIAAYLEEIDEVTTLIKDHQRQELNIIYVPVKRKIEEGSLSPGQLLTNYDFSRAKKILALLRKDSRVAGPYIVSTRKPISLEEQPDASSRYLWQDLTHVDPKIVSLWVLEFKKQAAHEKFWKPSLGAQTILSLRNGIAKGATIIEPARSWIDLLGPFIVIF